MKPIHKFTALILAAALLAAGCQGDEAKPNIISSARCMGQARGFFVTAEELADPTEAIIFAANNHFSSIFAEVQTDKTQSLVFLCEEAKKRAIEIVAVLDPFGEDEAGNRPDPTSAELHKTVARDAAQLAKEYDVAGVVLCGMDAAFMQGAEVTEGVEKLTEAVAKAVHKADRSTMVGIAFDATNEHNAMTVAAAERLAKAHSAEIILPQMNTEMEYSGETGYLPLLRTWTEANLGRAKLYTGNLCVADNPYRLHNQLLANAAEGDIDGAVLSPYSVLKEQSREENELIYSFFAPAAALPAADLTFPRTLAINYPEKNITVYDDCIYIMGTSDPTLPLTHGGEEIPRAGERGAYGLKIDLAKGENIITVEQGEQKATVTVTRGSASAEIMPIKEITAATLFPQTPLGVDSNETVTISCVGPSGASVTATLGGETVLLAQTAKAKAKGTPVNFSGNVTLKSADYPADEVTNIGKVTYVVSMGEEHAVQSSPAEVFVAGISVPLTLEIPKEVYLASVLTDLKSDDSFTQTLKSGGRAAIKGRATTVRDGKPVIAYKLSGGGYILGDRANIVTDGALCGGSITELARTAEGDEEIYEFRGGQPAVLTEWGDTTLKLRFLNTKLSADVQTMAGGLIKTAEQTDTADGAELLLTFDAGSLWGYDITHGGEATTLYLRRTPKRSEIFGKPLAGISVMLDPGHGGSDPGALGVAGSTGPTEAVLNMSVASLAKLRLEQLGARVTMTRADESVRVTLDERTFMAQQQRPHIFLSIHHNSTALTKDLAEVQHMESYYRENTAAPLSDSLMKHLTDTLGRKPGESQKAYFYVTRLTFAPSVLFEMGFIVNPAQYENACDRVSMYKAADGIAMAIVDIVK